MSGTKKAILAFSGGLDTSYCALHLRQDLGYEVITLTVDTGGFTPADLRDIEARSKECGAAKHLCMDGKQAVYDDFIAYIIKGNILRGGVYPLSVAAERITQARMVVELAQAEKAQAVAHGSTGAGNDQVRFDVTAHVLGEGLEILTPIRTQNLSREQSTAYLQKHGISIAAKTTSYSINAGLWGTTIGGKETHDPWQYPPEDVFQLTAAAEAAPAGGEVVTLGFENGMPTTLNGKPCAGPDLVKQLNELGGRHGVGRGIHVGDTIIGIKGRIAFEAPAPHILIQAHRELEKLVLGKHQAFWKQTLGDTYGQMLHEGDYFDPVMRDIERFLDSTQERVTGEARVRLRRGAIVVEGARSPWSLFDTGTGRYGEVQSFWNGADAAGFAKLKSVSARIARKAGPGGKAH